MLCDAVGKWCDGFAVSEILAECELVWLKVDVEPRKDRPWLTSEVMQRNNQGLQD